MTLPVPINRTELYLAKIAGEDVTIPTEPINNTEVFLARLAGADIVLPTPINTLQVWLAILCGEQYTTPPVQGAELIGVQMVRTEFLAASAGVDGITTPTPENRAEEYWAKIAEELSVHTITVKGTNLHLLHIVSGIEDFQYVYGDTEQTKYSGKNLLELANYTAGNVVTTLNSDGTITTASSSLQYNYANFMTYQKAISLPAGTYAFSRSGDTTYRASIDIWDSSKSNHKTISLNAGVSSASFDTSWDIAYIAGAYTSLTVGSALNTTSGFQIEKGSATAFEPYVGGTPSPNPDYPQDVHVVTGSQVVNVHGKNLFNKNNAVSGSYLRNDGTESATGLWAVTDYIAITPNTTYTLSGISGGVGANPSRCYYDANKNFISGVKHNSNTATTFTDTSPNGAYYMRESLRVADIATTQIEKGSTATAYEPNTDYSLTLGSLELCKIGDYQDYIYKSDDDWYVHKEVGEKVFDGTENWSFNANSSLFRSVVSDAALSPATNIPPILSGHYTPASFNDLYDSVVGYGISLNNNNHWVCIRNKDIPTVADFKTWLSTHNTSVYYALATPTDTKITDATLVSQLNALDSAILPTPEAFVTVSGNLPAPIQFTYQGKL